MSVLLQRFHQAAAEIDMAVLGPLNAAFETLPKPLAILAAIITTLFAIAVSQRITRSLRRNSAPVFEGIPFIGGIIKFAKVCNAVRQHQADRITDACSVPLDALSLTHGVDSQLEPTLWWQRDLQVT